MSERESDHQQAGTTRAPASANEIPRLAFGGAIETRSLSDVLTAIRDRAEDAAARSVRLRASDSFS